MPILETPIFELVECKTDANGNIIYKKSFDSVTTYYEYDSKGTMNTKRTVRGLYEHIEEYNDKSQLIYELVLEVGKDDKEYHYAYHDNGFKSYAQTPNVEIYYDESGNLLKYRYDTNSDIWFDANGFRIEMIMPVEYSVVD
jgi:hypothetical protein